MTNHQSNIIFYTVISIIVTAIIIQVTNPDVFSNIGKNKEELLLKEAVEKGDHNQALVSYRILVEQRIDNGNEISDETAVMYEDMAKLHASLGNKAEEKNYYLKSLNVKEKLPKNDVFAFANTYYQLGVLAEEEQQYSRALAYFEKALAKRLGDTTEEETGGFTTTMHKSRLNHIRLNNEGTIDTFIKLAEMHIIREENAVAKTYYERALTASKLVFGENESETRNLTDIINELDR